MELSKEISLLLFKTVICSTLKQTHKKKKKQKNSQQFRGTLKTWTVLLSSNTKKHKIESNFFHKKNIPLRRKQFCFEFYFIFFQSNRKPPSKKSSLFIIKKIIFIFEIVVIRESQRCNQVKYVPEEHPFVQKQ